MTSAVTQLGLADANVTRVLRDAHMSTKTFYEHFEDRDAGLTVAWELTIGRVRDRIRADVSPKSGSAQQLQDGLRSLLAELEADPDAARLRLMHWGIEHPELVGRRERIAGELASALEARSCNERPLVAEALVRGATELVAARLARTRRPRLSTLEAA